MGVLRIVSYSSERFRDRAEAGKLLAYELRELRGRRPVVLGIPRGGIIVAREMARALDGELDIVLSRKLRTPGQWELAMGSVSEDGKLFLNDAVIRGMSVINAYIQQEKEVQIKEIARRRELIRKIKPRVSLEGRIVIVTDDGIATGATAQAAFWAARQEHPEKLIAAFPVGPQDTVTRLAQDVDEMVCLRAPEIYYAVGQFYARFEQIEDEEVLEIMREEAEITSERGRRFPLPASGAGPAGTATLP